MEAVRNLEPVLIFLMLGPLNDTSKSFNRSLGKIGVDWDHIIQKNSHNLPYKLVGGIPTPLKNTKVSWDYYSQYIENTKCFKPPSSWANSVFFVDRFVMIHQQLTIFEPPKSTFSEQKKRCFRLEIASVLKEGNHWQLCRLISWQSPWLGRSKTSGRWDYPLVNIQKTMENHHF
jgi:hypothetical protein